MGHCAFLQHNELLALSALEGSAVNSSQRQFPGVLGGHLGTWCSHSDLDSRFSSHLCSVLVDVSSVLWDTMTQRQTEQSGELGGSGVLGSFPRTTSPVSLTFSAGHSLASGHGQC